MFFQNNESFYWRWSNCFSFEIGFADLLVGRNILTKSQNPNSHYAHKNVDVLIQIQNELKLINC